MVRDSKSGRESPGFTLMEMLIVLAIVGALAAVAAPAVKGALVRAKEAALRENLFVMRRLIDEYASDRGQQPETLETLVKEGYLRAVPPDSVHDESKEWQEVPAESGGIKDVQSKSTGKGLNGVPYAEW